MGRFEGIVGSRQAVGRGQREQLVRVGLSVVVANSE